MDQNLQSNRINGLFWVMLAAVATAAVCLVSVLSLPVPDVEPELFELYAAMARFDTLVLKIVLLIPLLCVTPALWARSAWRLHPMALAGLTLFLFAFGALLTHNALQGLYLVGLLAPSGILLYGMQRWKLSNFKVVFYGSILLLFGLFIYVCLPSYFAYGDAFLPLRNAITDYRIVFEQTAAELSAIDVNGLLRPMIESVSEATLAMKLDADQYLVAYLYYPAAIATLSNALLSYLWNRKGGAQLIPLRSFSDWMVESQYVIGVVLLSILSYILVFSGVSFGSGLVRIAYVLWMLPMGLLGLCTVKKWTASKPWIFILVCVVCGLLFQTAMQFLPIVGMFGYFWDRMRRRSQGGNV